MKNRKKIIDEIMANFQAMKNKIQTKVLQSDHNSLVTSSQWFVLVAIDRKSNMGIKEISKMLGASSSAATQLVDGLADNGYVLRNDDPEDRRALQLKLSTKGKKYILKEKKEHTKKIVKMFNVLDDKELMAYLELHKKILTNISNENIL